MLWFNGFHAILVDPYHQSSAISLHFCDTTEGKTRLQVACWMANVLRLSLPTNQIPTWHPFLRYKKQKSQKSMDGAPIDSLKVIFLSLPTTKVLSYCNKSWSVLSGSFDRSTYHYRPISIPQSVCMQIMKFYIFLIKSTKTFSTCIILVLDISETVGLQWSGCGRLYSFDTLT